MRSDLAVPSPNRVELATRSQLITQQIRDRILDGTYPPDFHMNEAELSSAFNVSRTPIRAALTKLSAEGLLLYKPNTGYLVRSFSRDDVVKIYEVRAVLFGLAAKRAAVYGLNERFKIEAATIIESATALLAYGEWSLTESERWGQMGARFVALIEDAAANEYLTEASKRSREIPQLTAIRFRWLNKKVAQRLHISHIELFSAIEERDQTRAENLAREHVFLLCRSAMAEIDR